MNLAGLTVLNRSNRVVWWEHQIEGFNAFQSTAPVLADRMVYSTSNANSGVVALGDMPGNDEE